MTETPPITCTLTDEQAATRPNHVLETMQETYREFATLSTGLRLVFSGTDATIGALATFVVNELKCCSFAEYEIAVSPPYTETTLTITGPDGTGALFEQTLIPVLTNDERI